MQNKANLLDSQMNVSYVKTKNYEQKTMDNEPVKQTQSNPIYGEPVEPTKPVSILLNLEESERRNRSRLICRRRIYLELFPL
jgi:hypothetical protein